jgi:hypothetical protein
MLMTVFGQRWDQVMHKGSRGLVARSAVAVAATKSVNRGWIKRARGTPNISAARPISTGAAEEAQIAEAGRGPGRLVRGRGCRR